MSLSEKDKKKLQEKHEKILQDLLKEPANRTCADCGERGPRWASSNIGCFICIRCAGFHRRLGTHISKVKSVTLDSWAPDQIEIMKSNGNGKVNAIFNPFPIQHPPPSSNDLAMEQYIREKYERKSFVDRSVPSVQMPGSSNSLPQFTPVERSMNELRLKEKYFAELSHLRDMGFKDDPSSLLALDKTKGDVNAAIEYLVSRKVQDTPPERSSSSSSETTARKSNLPTTPASPNKKIVQPANTQTPQPTSFSISNAISTIRSMGFTNTDQILNALQKSNNDISAAIELLINDQQNNQIDHGLSNLKIDQPQVPKKIVPEPAPVSLLSDTIDSNIPLPANDAFSQNGWEHLNPTLPSPFTVSSSTPTYAIPPVVVDVPLPKQVDTSSGKMTKEDILSLFKKPTVTSPPTIPAAPTAVAPVGGTIAFQPISSDSTNHRVSQSSANAQLSPSNPFFQSNKINPFARKEEQMATPQVDAIPPFFPPEEDHDPNKLLFSNLNPLNKS